MSSSSNHSISTCSPFFIGPDNIPIKSVSVEKPRWVRIKQRELKNATSGKSNFKVEMSRSGAITHENRITMFCERTVGNSEILRLDYYTISDN